MGLFSFLSFSVFIYTRILIWSQKFVYFNKEDTVLISESSFVFWMLSVGTYIADSAIDAFIFSTSIIITVSFWNMVIAIFKKTKSVEKWFYRLLFCDFISLIAGIFGYENMTPKEHLGISSFCISSQMMIIILLLILFKKDRSSTLLKQSAIVFTLLSIIMFLLIFFDGFELLIGSVIFTLLLAVPMWKTFKVQG